MSAATTEAPANAIGEVPSFNVTIMVRRFNPEFDSEPKWQDFDLTM